MKKYEETLLKKLKLNNTKDKPLSNVKNAIGSIAFSKGNPLSKTEIGIQVNTYFLQIQGGFPTIFILPPALPANLQTYLPCFLFGLNDFGGGFYNAFKVIQPDGGWVALNPLIFGVIFSGIYEYNIVIGDNQMLPILSRGDLVFWFTNTQGLPPITYHAYVVVHCNNVAYGTFLQSLWSDLITIDLLRYIVPVADILQFNNPLVFGYQSLFGKLYTDNIDPRMYITSRNVQQQIADIPLDLPIDKAMFLGFKIDVQFQQLNFVLFVKKVEALTHKISNK